jgi:hypothetical protein
MRVSKSTFHVIPAKAGIQDHGFFRTGFGSWIPAFAGMTEEGEQA